MTNPTITPQDTTALTQFLNNLNDGLLKSSTFVIEQAPEVVQQLLTFKFVEAMFIIILSLSTQLVITFLCVKLYNIIENDADMGPLIFSMVVINLLSFCIVITTVVESITTLLQIHLAPKVYLLEYTAGLIK